MTPNSDGERQATVRQLEQHGFIIQDPPTDTDTGQDHSDLDFLFDGPDLIETREGCERTLRAVPVTGGADK